MCVCHMLLTYLLTSPSLLLLSPTLFNGGQSITPGKILELKMLVAEF